MIAQAPAVETALTALRAGGVVVLYDERTDTADLIAAAALVTAETVNVLVREAGGFVAVALEAERCDALGIRPIPSTCAPSDRSLPYVTVEARTGTATGISAADRARTIRVAGVEGRAGDLVSPGHVSPLRAAEGGLLARQGRVEAAVDAMRLAGLAPAAAICDVLDEDGELAGSDRLPPFAQVSIAELTAARFDAWATL